jgi:hypothetical protein
MKHFQGHSFETQGCTRRGVIAVPKALDPVRKIANVDWLAATEHLRPGNS